MTIGHFIWTDLSTYDMAAAKSDYATLFGWTFHGDGTYDFVTQNDQEVAAIFPMPSRLAEMNMPSFWMSYVHVENVDKTVAKARSHKDVIIEIEPQTFSTDARIALVRDPSGAGFTLYQGPDITPPGGGYGQVAMRYHHVPDIKLIKPFYGDLFGWTFNKITDEPWPTFNIEHTDGSMVAQAEEVPDYIRGKYRYWIPGFKVESLQEIQEKLKSLGGETSSELSHNRILVADRQEGHFIVQATNR